MARRVLHSSAFLKILVGVVCLLVAVCLHAPVALAQHGGGAHAGGFGGGGHFGGGGGHFGGGHSAGGAHASASRGSKPAPGATSGTPPSTFAPRTSILPPTRTSFNGGNAGTAGNIRPRPVPRPTPPPVSIIYIPVYYSPFFYGGFNSFGCDPFWGWGGCYSPFGFGYGGFGYGGGYYGGFYNGWGWGNYGWSGYSGAGIGAGSNTYSSANGGGQATTPQTYVAPSYPTDTRAREMVELFFKDGTVFNVIDYWLVDGQLHFLTVSPTTDERSEKAVEHVLPFDTLDVQKTTDVNTDRGFKFQLRNESMEQYLRNHPEAEPKVDPDAPHNP